MPPKKTLGQVHDFGVIMLKALLSGWADTVVGLAKVNLRAEVTLVASSLGQTKRRCDVEIRHHNNCRHGGFAAQRGRAER